MLTGPALRTALPSLPTCSFDGVLYRAVDLESLFGFHQPTPYPQPLPLFSEGARQRGARYTPIGGPASLYLALDPQTAFAIRPLNPPGRIVWSSFPPVLSRRPT